MPTYTPADWATHLRHVATSAAGPAPPRNTAIGRAFAAAVCPTGELPPQTGDLPVEVGLWWHLAGAQGDVESLLAGSCAGPLWPALRSRGLEVWTEAELCGLHALWGLARRHARSDWNAQAEAVRDWHIENTQPDNATNRPWALHVFLLAGSPEGLHYAETLLHNALVTGPEPFCAWILMDVATWLEGEGS